MIRSGLMKHVLVVSSEILSSTVNWTDRDTCVLFGDGAGAVVYSSSTEEGRGILSMTLGGDGTECDILKLPNSGCRRFPEHQGSFIQMQGNDVFKLAVRTMSECATEVLTSAGLTTEDVSLIIPHQANIRIIEAIATRLKLPSEKVFVNIEKYGNTSSATIPIALCEAFEQGRLKKGDVVVFDAFGAGLTWGAMVLKV
jgi:3-oxoacyl-[acyl-carrier-protein] synthase-3